MSLTPESLLAFAIPFALIAAGIGVLIKVVGAKWILGLFESEGEPSLRLVIAGVLSVFGMCLFAAHSIDSEAFGKVCSSVEILLLIGASKIVGSRFAGALAAPTTQIKAQTAPVTTESTTITTPANGQPQPEKTSPPQAD